MRLTVAAPMELARKPPARLSWTDEHALIGSSARKASLQAFGSLASPLPETGDCGASRSL